ncbi:MAG: sulfatase [Opitutae bacterium]|nr:sulfatase [Opitutae bacterium]
MKKSFAILFALAPLLASAKKPNILFIIADDQAPLSIGAVNNPEIKTPNLDRLAKQSVLFNNCFNQGSWSGAVCVASRTMLITGQSVFRAPKNKPYLDKWANSRGAIAVEGSTEVKLWPEVFRDAGYDTFLTGKWHNNYHAALKGFSHAKAIAKGMYETFDPSGSKKPGYNRPTPTNNHWTPWDPKFTGHWTPFVRDIASKNGVHEVSEEYTVKKHTSELFADHAIKFLSEANKTDKPFFMYVAFNAPHDPRQAPKEFVEMYPPSKIKIPENYLPEHPFDNGAIKIRDEALAPFPRSKEVVQVHRSEYYAIITHMDREIGRILKALKKSGQAENTYVVFTADHGLAVGQHGLMGKQNPYDHSIKMPFMISGPGIRKGATVDEKIYMQSVYPTTCELAGLKVPETVDYSSIVPLVYGKKGARGEDLIFNCYIETQRLVRTDLFKLVHYPKIGRNQLFDLKNDPRETKDLIDDPKHAAVRKDLLSALQKKRKELGDGLLSASPRN